MPSASRAPLIAIACGGTGGHLFPGLAVAEVLEERGVETLVLISTKEVDRQAVRGLPASQVEALPGVGLERGRRLAFVREFVRALGAARRLFRSRPPAAVLAMGGFTSVPPVLAARRCRAATFLHEANAIPGRANRWLAHFVDEAFVHFDSAVERLWHQHIRVVGMPVRSQFRPADPADCRLALGLRPQDPVLLVTGGSQGARALNELVLRTWPSLRLLEPRLQLLHLAGAAEADAVKKAYAARGGAVLVRPFLTEMELALGAATVMVSRAGASSLAEAAAMRVPALVVPLPTAADNHQFYNARAFVEAGAARMLNQAEATPEKVLWELRALLQDGSQRATMQAALAKWHAPEAAATIAEVMMKRLGFAGRPALGSCAVQAARPTRNERERVALAVAPPQTRTSCP